MLPNDPRQIGQLHQQNNTATTPTTCNDLLYILPPFARAQVILHQMGVLAPRLYEVSSKKPTWLNAFRATATLPTFLSSRSRLVTPPPLESTAEEILAILASLQAQLVTTVAELQQVLDLQDAIKKVSSEISSKDSVMRAFANKLREGETVLDKLVDDYSDYRQPKRLISDDETPSVTIGSGVKVSDILSYAQKISYTTFAPPKFGAGLAPLRATLPPAPQEEQMRASQLYTFADLDIGLSKTLEEKAVESLIEPTFPAEWKPGMPTDIPLPPHGWKPDDPITLPPIHAPGQIEKHQTMPQPGFNNALVPSQVRFVQLDIDQDDYSSEYTTSSSSSETSSDED